MRRCTAEPYPDSFQKTRRFGYTAEIPPSDSVYDTVSGCDHEQHGPELSVHIIAMISAVELLPAGQRGDDREHAELQA
jgi:hypothetical protein